LDEVADAAGSIRTARLLAEARSERPMARAIQLGDLALNYPSVATDGSLPIPRAGQNRSRRRPVCFMMPNVIPDAPDR
jgi:hypothetical protein